MLPQVPYKVVRDESVGHLINDAGCILLEHITKREKPIAKVHKMRQPYEAKGGPLLERDLRASCRPGLSTA